MNVLIDELNNELMTPELKQYVEAVEKLAKAKSDKVFKNSSHKHASVVISAMMNNSEKEFCIYDDNLSGDIADKYEGFYPALKKYAEEGKLLKFVIIDHKYDTATMFKELKELNRRFPETVLVKEANEDFIKAADSVYNMPLNFAVADSRAFRLEETDRKKSDAERKALCSFNQSEIANKLRNVFTQEFDSCPSFF